MNSDLSRDEAIALYDEAPYAYITTLLDGTIVRINETFARWVGCPKQDLLKARNLREFFTASSNLFYETYYVSVLQVQGATGADAAGQGAAGEAFIGDMSLEILRPGQAPMPVLFTSVVHRNGPHISVSSTMFDITDRRRYEGELVAAKRRADTLADVVRYSETAIMTVSYDLEIESWNMAAGTLFEQHEPALSVKAPLEAFLPESHVSRLIEVLESNSPLSFEHLFREKVLCRVNVSPTSNGLAIFFSDITEDRASQRALQDAHERFRLATMATTDGILDWNCMTGEFYASARVQQILGLEGKATAVLDLESWSRRIHPKDRAHVEAALTRLQEISPDRHFENEFRILHEDGSWRWVHNRYMPLYSAANRLTRVVSSLRDITSHKVEDTLTRLHTRLSLLDRLEWRMGAEDRHQYGCALIFIDLDGFKRVNDGFGHSSGDLLLIEFARRMQDLIGSEPKNLAARLGGDEFVVLLDEVVDDDDARRQAQRIQDFLLKPIICGEHQVTLSASIGIALSRDIQGSAEDLLRNADVAMYHAKASGKAQSILFSEAMHHEVLEQIALENDLRVAVQQEHLMLHYQPKVILETGKIIGFEALLRWNHPTRGMIPPDIFIAIAEESNLICEIGRWTLGEAMRQLAVWRARKLVPPGTTVAVNLSPKQFGDSLLLEILSEQLALTGLPPSCVELEVTEGVLIGDSSEALRVLQLLKSVGVGLELDDFGKGYSSLSYLHRYPFSSLKVDRSFVSSLGMDGDGTTITRSIIALGQALGLEVIAEGIETEEQVHRLRAMKCPFGQGYFFSRPLPPEGIEALLGHGTSMATPVSEATPEPELDVPEPVFAPAG